LVNEQRKKLSKRKDPVATESFRDLGYLAETFVNYLALMGWSPKGDAEKVPLSNLIEEFRLEDVSHSPAFFDVKKMTHMNGEYIRELSAQEFVIACEPWVAPWLSDWQPSDREAPWDEERYDPALFALVAPLIQERVAILSEVPSMLDFFFLEAPNFDEEAFDKAIGSDPNGRHVLVAAIELFDTLEWSADVLHQATIDIGESMELPLRKTQAPIRCAITGSLVGPPLFESLEILGRDRTLALLRDALARPIA
jgi:glutamyl-tRNA synthetase